MYDWALLLADLSGRVLFRLYEPYGARKPEVAHSSNLLRCARAPTNARQLRFARAGPAAPGSHEMPEEFPRRSVRLEQRSRGKLRPKSGTWVLAFVVLACAPTFMPFRRAAIRPSHVVRTLGSPEGYCLGPH